MSSSIHGVNFDNQTVTAKDHGHLFHCVIVDGIMSGCELSFSGTSLVITPGYLLIGGREMKLTANTTVIVSGSTTGFARVLITIDLTKAATADTFEQADFQIQYANTATGFSALNQEDINRTGTTYQFGEGHTFYLSADGDVTREEPVFRAEGKWEVLALEETEDLEEKVQDIFSQNSNSHKIEWRSTKPYELYDTVVLRLDGGLMASYVSYIGVSSADHRYYYKSGELATTLTERLKGANV